jgi:hypothetical protein
VRQPIEEMGRLGVSTLLAQLRHGHAPGMARLPTELVVRGSVAKPTLRRRSGSEIRGRALTDGTLPRMSKH